MHIKIPPVSQRPRFSMPTRACVVALALGTSVAFCTLPARAAEEAASTQAAADANSYRLFYDKLADNGDWFQTDDYGYVFQPRAASSDKTWRPYTDGYWATTDAGWTWVSNEDFGWACYHYGRWANLVDTGWVWVPGADWSPGFVSWRVSKDHKRVGWAPLPPEARVSQGEAVESWVDSAYDIGPDAYVFIDTNHFGEDSYRSHLIPFEQNATIITETENVTRINYRTVESRSIIYDGGPDVAIIRESGGRPLRELRLETRPESVEFFQRGDRRTITEVNGNRLVIATAAPDVITSNTIRISEPAHINRRLTSVTVDRGYRGIRDPQQVEHLRASIRSQSPPAPPQIQERAAAAMRRDRATNPPERNGANVPVERNGQPDHPQPATGTPRNEPRPTATIAPTPVREQTRPETSPAATPGHTAARSPAPTPAITPEKGERDRQHDKATPEATPAARASATPETDEEDRANKHPESSPTPRQKGEREKQPEKSASPTPEPSTAATPRHATERTEDKPAKPEATRDRTERQDATQREEKPRSSEGDEKKSVPVKPETPSASRRNPEESREKPTENAGKERPEKKEAPAAPSAEKASPKP